MSDPAAVERKKALRREMRERLDQLSAEERQRRSENIVGQIVALEEWRDAEVIAMFEPMRSEPDVRVLQTFALEAGKTIAPIPLTARVESDVVFATMPELVLVPGLAFTIAGDRLGRGGGFFDRWLVGPVANAFKLGVCFAFQIVDDLPVEEHDIFVDAVVTDD